MVRDLSHNKKDRAPENLAPEEERTSVWQELAAAAWTLPAHTKRASRCTTTVNKIANGARDGLQQLVSEQKQNLASMPAPLIEALQAQVDTLSRIGRYCAEKMRTCDVKGLVNDAGRVGIALEEALGKISHLTPYQLGRTIGHDLPPVIAGSTAGFAVAKVPTILKELKCVNQASHIVAMRKRVRLSIMRSCFSMQAPI